MGTQGADLEEDRGIWGSSTHVKDLVDLFHTDELMFQPRDKYSNFFKPLQTYIFWPNRIWGKPRGWGKVMLNLHVEVSWHDKSGFPVQKYVKHWWGMVEYWEK